MFPSERFIQEAFEQSLLSTANKAYAKLCHLCLNAGAIYHFAYVTLKSYHIQTVTRQNKGPCLPVSMSSTAQSHLRKCKEMLNALLDAHFPDTDDPALIELNKLCTDALVAIENYNPYGVTNSH